MIVPHETLTASEERVTDVDVRLMDTADSDAVLRIYQEGLDTCNASFETTAPPWSQWNSRHTAPHRFVATVGGDVVGWAATAVTSTRPVYAGVLEESVYVSEGAQGRGVGRALLARLIASTEQAGVWTLQAGVFPENTTSLALHAAAGFRTVGRRERIGCMNGVWRDVVLLERRSGRAGT
jgi:L-amino acid N-acyltransferase YncA